MNKKAKGHKAENEIAEHYEHLGYSVQVAQRTSVFTGRFYVSRDNDFFNLFDLLVLGCDRIQLIQVKSNVSHVYGAKNLINSFAHKINNNNISYSVALRVSRKGWVLWDCTWNNTIKEYVWDISFRDLKFNPCNKFVYS